jgi:hypothetical protein
MDEILELENAVIEKKKVSMGLALFIADLEEQMYKEVELEAKDSSKKSYNLSNDKLRKIEANKRLREKAEYTEAIADKFEADVAIMYGEARIRSLEREFIVNYCQEIKLPVSQLIRLNGSQEAFK